MSASGGGGRRYDTALAAFVTRRFEESDRRTRRVLMALISTWLVACAALAIFAPHLVVHWVIGAVVGGMVGRLISLAVFR